MSVPRQFVGYKGLVLLADSATASLSRATSTQDGNDYIIKEFRTGHPRDPELRNLAESQFINELRVLASLHHPAIPRLHHWGYKADDDSSYLVLHAFHGKPLIEAARLLPLSNL